MRKRFKFIAGVLAIAPLLLLLTGCPQQYKIKADDNICLEPYKNYTYLLCDNLIVEINDHPIELPVLFKTDLASFPRPLWSIYSPAKSEYMMPAIIHDYLYSCESTYSRIAADDIFYNLLRHNHVPYFRAYLFYGGVRLFGEKHYHVKCRSNRKNRADSSRI